MLASTTGAIDANAAPCRAWPVRRNAAMSRSLQRPRPSSGAPVRFGANQWSFTPPVRYAALRSS
ncbi:hypothetical protein ACT79_17660 [Burkholderia pseudomallei]|nr:hypothetical protein ACT79_17660 [Burkholderia pseudomallei]